MKYTWIISEFECKPSQDGLTNIITSIYWVYKGEDDICFEMFGNVKVGNPNPDNFIDYNDITFEQVVVWLENILDITSMQNNIVEQIDLIKNPKLIKLSPPFSVI